MLSRHRPACSVRPPQAKPALAPGARINFSSARGDGEGESKAALPVCSLPFPGYGGRIWPVAPGPCRIASLKVGRAKLKWKNETQGACSRGWQWQTALPALGTPRQLPPRRLRADCQAPGADKEPQVVSAPSGPPGPPAWGVLGPLEELGLPAGTAQPAPSPGCRGAGARGGGGGGGNHSPLAFSPP